METEKFDLRQLPGLREGVLSFNSLEMVISEYSPLALVWYTIRGDESERATRIDLHKGAFLDDIGVFSHDTLDGEAAQIVQFAQEFKARQFAPVAQCGLRAAG